MVSQAGCWAEITTPRVSLWITQGRPSATSDRLSLHLLCKEDNGLGKHVLACALGPGAGVHWGPAGPAFQEHGVSWETLPFNQDFKP